MTKYKPFPADSDNNVKCLEGVQVGDKFAVYISGWSSGYWEIVTCKRITPKQAEIGNRKYWIKNAEQVAKDTYSRGGWLSNLNAKVEEEIAHDMKVRAAKKLVGSIEVPRLPEDLLFILATAIEKYHEPKPAEQNAKTNQA